MNQYLHEGTHFPPGIQYNNQYTIFIARTVITHDLNLPKATAICVHRGIIISVGSQIYIENELKAQNIPYEINDQFKHQVIYPGFIEAHMHPTMAGLFDELPYVGYYDIQSSEGTLRKGCATLPDIIDRLKKDFNQKTSKGWFNAWGFDFMLVDDGKMLDRFTLDQVSTEVPIVVANLSGHLFSLNTKATELANFFHTTNPFVFKNKQGEPTGVIGEAENIAKVLQAGGFAFGSNPQNVLRWLHNSIQMAHRKGCTTIADLSMGDPTSTNEQYLQAYQYWGKQENIPMRFSLCPNIAYIKNMNLDTIWVLKKQDNDRVSIDNIKIIIDGSIQGYTANLLDKNYYDGTDNKPLVISKKKLYEMIKKVHMAGLSCSIHTNGDGATEAAIETIEKVQEIFPRPDVRHSLEHNQMVSENQLYRMKKAGIVTNLFVNHIYYWGDAHAKYTLGPALVQRMDPLKSAVTHGVPFSIHSDCPITPVNPLHSAWIAVNRTSAKSGTVYGKDQCISTSQAMYAITMGAAYLLHQEAIKGSITPGKLADFTVLESEVTEKNKHTFKDIPIIATVVGGHVFQIDKPS